MQTFNIEANMNAQARFGAGMNSSNRCADFQSAFTELPIAKPPTSRRSAAPVATPLINTPLQRGVRRRERCLNRFSGFPGRTGFCEASETAEAVPGSRKLATTPLKRGVNEIRTATAALLPLLLTLACLALSTTALAQPANYTDETVVATYVKGMLYWTNADAATRDSAAFRYKDLLYTNEATGIRPDRSRMSAYYGRRERARAHDAESDLRAG